MSAVLAGTSLLLLILSVALASWLRRRVIVTTVRGLSMSPTLRPGDRLLVRRSLRQVPEVGQVVVFQDYGPCRPNDPTGVHSAQLMVKRVAAVPGEPSPACLPAWARPPSGRVPPGHLVLLGDNNELSRDSRHFGLVRLDRVLGVVVRRLGGGPVPPSRPVSRAS